MATPVTLVDDTTPSGKPYSAANPLPTAGPTGGSADQVQGPVADDAAAVGNPVPVGGIHLTTSPTYANGDRTQLQAGSAGLLMSSIGRRGTYSDGILNTNIVWPFGYDDGRTAGGSALATAMMVFNNTTWDRAVKPNAASRIASAAASVNATSAKGAAGNVFRVYGNNAKASIVYLKIYNKATAPTVGTDTPVLTIPIAASSRFDIDIGAANGFYLGTGIAYGFTTDAADSGTTALLAADILGFTLTYA